MLSPAQVGAQPRSSHRTLGCSSLSCCGTYVLGGRPRGGGGGCQHGGGGGGWQVTCRHTRSPVRLDTQGRVHQRCSHSAQSCQGHPAPHPTPRTGRAPGQKRGRCSRSPSRLCPAGQSRTKLGHTVGSGVELQAERASTALQGTLLLPAALGAARLRAAAAAAPGCVVRAGETIKLQRAESRDKMSVKRCLHKRA